MFTIGGLAVTGLIIYFIFKYKNLKKIFIALFSTTATIELFIGRGYFAEVGDQQLTYAFFCEIILGLLSVIFLFRHLKIRKDNLQLLILVNVVVIVGLLGLLVWPSGAQGGNFRVSWDEIVAEHYPLQNIQFIPEMTQVIIHLFLYLLISFVAFSILTKNEWIHILVRVLKNAKLFIFYGLVEFIIVYVFKSQLLYSILNTVLGVSNSTVLQIVERGNGYSLVGLTREPSHYAFVLTISIIFLISLIKMEQSSLLKPSGKSLSTKISISLGIFLLIVSMSFSSILFGTLLLLLYYLVISKKGRNNTIRIFIVLLILVLLVSNFAMAMTNITENIAVTTTSFWQRRLLSLAQEYNSITNGNWFYATTALEWSTHVRLGSTYETLKMLKYRPIFGLGWGSTTAHSALAMLVSGCGLLGSYIYIDYFSWARKIKLCNYNKQLFYTALSIYLAMNLLNSLSLRPFYELWTILLMFSFEILSKKEENNENWICNTSL